MHEIASNSGFASTLTSLVSTAFSKRTKSKLHVDADRILTSVLDNSDSCFKEATKLPATQSWIEQQIDQRNDIYMIVGFHSVTNAHIIQESHRGTTIDGQIQLPAALALAAAGVIVPLGDVLDLSVGRHRQILDEAQSQFQVFGDQICALQYRKTRHAWLSSKRIDKSRLSKPWWSSLERWRDEEGEDDIIEVELAQLDDLDEGWVREASGDDVFLVRQSDEF